MDIMINWYYNIWVAYLKEFNDYNEEKAGFFILDKATIHLGKKFIDLLTTGNQEYLLFQVV